MHSYPHQWSLVSSALHWHLWACQIPPECPHRYPVPKFSRYSQCRPFPSAPQWRQPAACQTRYRFVSIYHNFILHLHAQILVFFSSPHVFILEDVMWAEADKRGGGGRAMHETFMNVSISMSGWIPAAFSRRSNSTSKSAHDRQQHINEYIPYLPFQTTKKECSAPTPHPTASSPYSMHVIRTLHIFYPHPWIHTNSSNHTQTLSQNFTPSCSLSAMSYSGVIHLHL